MSLFGKSSDHSPSVTEDAILSVLKTIKEPNLGQDIVSLGMVRDLSIQGDQVAFTLAFTNQQPALVKAELHSRARRLVSKVPGVASVQAKMASAAQTAPHAQEPASDPRGALIPQVKHTIAVSSGKGGVGKSTVSVNLAIALHQGGAKVGLMDSDVYGPDIPLMMGAKGGVGMVANRIVPVESHGIKLISIGFFVKEGDPVVWRGPMIHSAIQQFLRDVEWGALDYLVIDMPPGTGDAQLSLSQIIPLSGALMVTTPQDVSLLDVRKGLAMFRRMNVPILGVVENMSEFRCPHCGHSTPIFGGGGGQKIAIEMGAPLLGQIPLDPETRQGGDEGLPIVVKNPDSAPSRVFRQLAEAVKARLDTLSELKLPSIH
jgi:ATP-binding protein involved in chromosome partitioning